MKVIGLIGDMSWNFSLGCYRFINEFVAEKLKKVFQVLKTPADVALHNDMVEDIQMMVDPNSLTTGVARILVSKPKNFLLSIAELIRNLSLRNLQNGK